MQERIDVVVRDVGLVKVRDNNLLRLARMVGRAQHDADSEGVVGAAATERRSKGQPAGVGVLKVRHVSHATLTRRVADFVNALASGQDFHIEIIPDEEEQI